MITWSDPDKRYYHHGLDRGVLYIAGMDPMAWNGLVNFDENGEGTVEFMYRDGVVFLADADPGDFSGRLRALFYPDAFGACIGIPKAADGLYVDNQKQKPFHFSYRTLVGSGSRGDMFGYQIHLVYNAMAAIGQRQRRTLGDDTTPTEFEFDIVCTPVKLPGYRPTAHYTIDTRGMSKSIITAIENILYGEGETPGRMPTPTELYELMNFGDAIIVNVHTDGTFTVQGSSDNVEELTPTTFIMRNINGTDNGDGTYVIADGGDTDVIIET